MAIHMTRPTDAVVDAISQPLKVGDVVAFTNNYYSMATLALVTKIGNADNVQLDGCSYVQRTSVIVVNDNLVNIGRGDVLQDLLTKYGDKMTEAPVPAKKETTKYLVTIVCTESYYKPDHIQIVPITGGVSFDNIYGKVRQEVAVHQNTMYIKRHATNFWTTGGREARVLYKASTQARESLIGPKTIKELGIDPSIHSRLSLEDFLNLLPKTEDTDELRKTITKSISKTPYGDIHPY